MKKGYYGVYGKNGGGIFTNWADVLYFRDECIGFKNKKFCNEIEALDYIVAGLVEDYKIISSNNLNEYKLLDNIGKFLSLRDLMFDIRKRVRPIKNYWDSVLDWAAGFWIRRGYIVP